MKVRPKVCVMPQISLVAWQDRMPTNFIFVRVPNERGRYLRTDRCVIEVPCTYPDCKSTVGEPCKGRDGTYNAATHYMRRTAWQVEKRRRQRAGQSTDVCGVESA